MTVTRIQVRRDTAAVWAAANPVLAPGEPGFELGTGRFKLGDGITAWNELRYAADPAATATYSLEDDYGAPSSGSVQTALQDAVNDILTVKGGGRLLLQDRIYDFDSITWPMVGLDHPTAVIEFVGPYRPATVGFMPGTGLTIAEGGDMPPPSKGAILKPTLASGSGFGTTAAAATNILPIFRNLIVRVPPNPQWHAISAGWALNLITDGVIVDTGRSWGDGSNPLSEGPIIQPTSVGVYGIEFPGPGNGGVCVARDVLVSGYYHGLVHSEHFDGDRITLAKNVVGYVPRDAWHASRIGRLSTYWNTYDIQPIDQAGPGSPGQRLQIAEWDTEEDPVGGNWYSTVYHLNDPNNYLRGRCNVHRMVPSLGPSSFLLRRGGAYFHDETLTAPRDLIDAVGFEGADSATDIPASHAGQPVQQVDSTWGIDGQRAYIVTPGSTAIAAWDFGVDQFVLTSRIKTMTTAGYSLLTGLALFVADASDLMFVVLTPTDAQLQKISGGAYTTLATSAAYPAITPGDEVTLRVCVMGKVIRAYLGDTLLFTYTMTSAEWAAYSPNTSHGFFAYLGGQESGGVTGSHWDHLRVERAGAVA